MPTERQLAANRQNAQRSTGPRTPQGKAVCAQNASRHGKLADEVLLACEDRRQFIRHSRRYHREFQPVGHFEKTLVNDMVAASWRRERMGVLEARLIDHSYNTIPAPLLPQPSPDAPAPHPDHSPVAFRNALGYRELADTSKVLPQLSRDAARHNRDFHKALATLLRLRATLAKTRPAPAGAPALDPEDPYRQGKYDRPVIPPPADPEGTIPEDLMGLFGSVSTPEPTAPSTPEVPTDTTESITCIEPAPPVALHPANPPAESRQSRRLRERQLAKRNKKLARLARRQASATHLIPSNSVPQAEPRPQGSVHPPTPLTTPTHPR